MRERDAPIEALETFSKRAGVIKRYAHAHNIAYTASPTILRLILERGLGIAPKKQFLRLAEPAIRANALETRSKAFESKDNTGHVRARRIAYAASQTVLRAFRELRRKSSARQRAKRP